MYRMVWTDERMDDFAKHTDQRFDAVDRRLDAVDRRLEGFDRRFEQVDNRLAGLHQMIHRTMLQLGIGMIVTLALGLMGVIATQ